MALPMLATGSISMIEEAIETENINYLKKFPKIGDKVARQLVLDLKGKLNVINTGLFKREDHSSELFDALVGLGYKQADVKKIVSKVDPTLDLENQIKEALEEKVKNSKMYRTLGVTVGLAISIILIWEGSKEYGHKSFV